MLKFNGVLEDKTLEFIDHIKNKKYKEAHALLEHDSEQVSKIYQDDKTGYSLMHIIFDETWYVFSEQYEALLLTMLEMRFPLNLFDNKNKLAVERMNPHKKQQLSALLQRAEYLLVDKQYINSQKNRVLPGRRVINDLTLFYKSKYLHKTCKIPDQWEDLNNKDGLSLTLHQRLALSEFSTNEFLTQPITSLDELDKKKPFVNSNNYFVVNIGFVVSSQSHEKDGTHTRQFYTMPISDDVYQHIRSKPSDNNSNDRVIRLHSEVAFHAVMTNKNFVDALIKKFINQFKIKAGFKIYAVILDGFSTQSICGSCEEIFYKLQQDRGEGSFLAILENILVKTYNLKLPHKKPMDDPSYFKIPRMQRLHMVTRVSHICDYSKQPRTQEMLGYHYSIIDKNTDNMDRNIKTFFNHVFIEKKNDNQYSELSEDGEVQRRSLTFLKKEASSKSFFEKSSIAKVIIPRHTAFINYYANNGRERPFKCLEHQSSNKNEAIDNAQLTSLSLK